MQSYAAHGGKVDKPASAPQKPVQQVVAKCPQKGRLIVKVSDYFDDQPIADAQVSVSGLGNKTTDKDGLADYGEVAIGHYSATAQKADYRPAPRKPVGPVTGEDDVADGKTTTISLKLALILKENVIFIGSEMDYKKFWTKMMFISAAYYEISNAAEFRDADKKTIAYADFGYDRWEKLAIDGFGSKGFDIKKIGSTGDITKLINDRPVTTINGKHGKLLLQDVSFFSHGKPSNIRLNYDGTPDFGFQSSDISSTSADAFVVDGRIYSYACRTGNDSYEEFFADDAGAHPETSLAQQMADHFQVEVHAFLTRSDYDGVLRDKSDSARIAGILKKARETDDGKLIDIPPDHEALPDPALKAGTFIGRGPKTEGTDKYALWRKSGGIQPPKSGTTPTGLTPGLQVFRPK